MADRTALSDEALVERLRRAPEGDLRPFELLVQRHQSRVLANCRYLTRSPATAEDLAQEVFVKAFFGLPGFEGRASFRTWLHRLKVNHCLSFLARRRAAPLSLEEPGVEARSELQVPARADVELEARDELTRAEAALDAMSDTLRVPLVMRDLDGLPYQEIADALGIGLSAVKMRIRRGREEFRRLFAARSRPGPGAP